VSGPTEARGCAVQRGGLDSDTQLLQSGAACWSDVCGIHVRRRQTAESSGLLCRMTNCLEMLRAQESLAHSGTANRRRVRKRVAPVTPGGPRLLLAWINARLHMQSRPARSGTNAPPDTSAA
jgi:hypothetical protein